MGSYILKRMALMIPTLLGIMLINFAIIQTAPGGPIQQIISKLKGNDSDLDSRVGGGGSDLSQASMDMDSSYRGSQGIDPEFIKQLEKQFGFDQPIHVRFWKLIKNYAVFDFGNSYFRDDSVIHIITSKLPVSISLGLWTTLIVYFISIPLGMRKAVHDGTRFDLWTSGIVIFGYAVPGFLFALLLIILFAGGSFFDIFPLRGLVSDHFSELNIFQKIGDYLWHITLPIAAMVISGFAKLTLLTKNAFLEEMNKPYVTTARAKGLHEDKILKDHIFRNAMLVVIAGFPSTFIHIFFTSSLLIEVLFSLDGLGLLGFESALSRDYPVMFGTLYMFTIIGMVLHLLGDIAYMMVDKRIDITQRRG